MAFVTRAFGSECVSSEFLPPVRREKHKNKKQNVTLKI